MRELPPKEAQAELSGGALLLDVREPWEYDLVHVDGSVHIPMDQVAERVAELDPDRTTVVICHTGRRSAVVGQILETKGFRDIVNLAGGIDAWAETIDPELERY